MTLPVYPLAQVLDIKKRRVEEQEKIVKEKELELQQEKDKLVVVEKERDRAKKHQQDKLNQLRQEMDHGTTSPKIQQMKAYLKVTKERLMTEEKKVEQQQEKVRAAEKNLEMAKSELKLRRQEVEKLETHRKDWEKEAKKELDAKEEKEMDEIGSIMYVTHKRGKENV